MVIFFHRDSCIILVTDYMSKPSFQLQQGFSVLALHIESREELIVSSGNPSEDCVT